MRGHRYLFTSAESGVFAGWHRDTSSIVGCSYGPCPLGRSSIILAHVAEPQKRRGECYSPYGWGVWKGETAGQRLASTLVPHPACGMITHAQPNLGQPKQHQLSFHQIWIQSRYCRDYRRCTEILLLRCPKKILHESWTRTET